MSPNGRRGYIFQNIICYCLTDCKRLHIHGISISKHHMLLFNLCNDSVHRSTQVFQNIICYCLTLWADKIKEIAKEFQNIICYCLTIEKTSFFNFFFQKKNDFMGFSNIFTNRPIKFNLS